MRAIQGFMSLGLQVVAPGGPLHISKPTRYCLFVFRASLCYSGRLGPTVGPIVRSRPTSTIPGVRGNHSPGARSTASTSIRKRFDLFAPKRRGNHSTNPSNVPPLTTRSAIPALLHAVTPAETTSRL